MADARVIGAKSSEAKQSRRGHAELRRVRRRSLRLRHHLFLPSSAISTSAGIQPTPGC